VKRRLIGIAVLMIASIVAIIWLQLRWLDGSYQRGKDQFDKSVKAATMRAFDKERSRVVSKIMRKGLDKKEIRKAISCEEGTMTISDEISWLGDSSVQNIYVLCEEGDSAYQQKLELTYDKRYISSTDMDSVQMSKVFMEAYREATEAPIDIVAVEENLAAALKNGGITLPYTLRFFPSYDPRVAQVSVDEHVFKLGRGAASIVFSGEKGFLYRQMWLSILSSFLLSALLILCMAYMLHTILRQKKLSEIKNDFISNMTHELKTPISVIAAANEAMRHFHVLDDQERTDKYLNISKNELDRLALMVDKVLQAARFEKEKIQLRPEPVSIPDLLHMVVENHRLNSNKEIRFHLRNELAMDNLSLDRMHFSNVLNNIIDNAVKYSGEQVEINAELKELDDNVVIRISDKGRGMKSETVKHLFEKFYREPTGDVHNVKGFGLGLHYVKNIMDLIGGNIGVKSQYGQGSEFTLSIPKSIA